MIFFYPGRRVYYSADVHGYIESPYYPGVYPDGYNISHIIFSTSTSSVRVQVGIIVRCPCVSLCCIVNAILRAKMLKKIKFWMFKHILIGWCCYLMYYVQYHTRIVNVINHCSISLLWCKFEISYRAFAKNDRIKLSSRVGYLLA